MKLIEVVGNGPVTINNQENSLVSKIRSMNKERKDINILELPDRFKQVAYDLYLRNVILIDDDGFMTLNEEDETDSISW